MEQLATQILLDFFRLAEQRRQVLVGHFEEVVEHVHGFFELAEELFVLLVAPGIAEALIATAVGLLAAIPATIFYNYFLGELRQVTAALDLFVADLDSDFRRLAGGASTAARAANG